MVNIFFFSILFYSIFVLPSFISILLQSSSKREGLYLSIIFSFIYLLIKRKKKFSSKFINIIFIITFILYTNLQILVLINFFSCINLQRFVYSLFLFITLLVVSFVFVDALFSVRDKVVNMVLNSAFLILSLDLISSLVDGRLLSSEKELFLFGEPSHFSLIYIPISSFVIFNSKFNRSIFTIILIIFISYYIKSLTLLFGSFIILFSLFARKRMYKSTILFVSLFSILVFSTPYFKERISFNEDNLNLSLLIFLDGWERAYLANILTDGFGIGFNQLGFYGIIGFFRELIFNMNSTTINLYDGGSTSCKVVAEFGLLGIILILSYLMAIKKYASRFLKTSSTTPKVILTYSFFIGSFLELFVRGTGYFNSGVIMLFVALLMNKRLKRNKIQNTN
jgi:hypothetical protein